MTTSAARAIADWFAAKITPLAERLDALERRIDAVEKRPGSFKGAWVPDETYGTNDGVQFDGHYWVCRATMTHESPGGSPDWVLAVHRGKQGKEGKPGRDFSRMAS